MGKFEKCTVAMLGGPCSQHVTGNTSRQNQPQSAIIQNQRHTIAWSDYYKANMASPNYSESHHNDKPNDTMTAWSISVTDTSCLKAAKLCLDNTGVDS